MGGADPSGDLTTALIIQQRLIYSSAPSPSPSDLNPHPTPNSQVIRPQLLRDGFEKVRAEGLEVTDDVSIIEQMGAPVKLTLGKVASQRQAQSLSSVPWRYVDKRAEHVSTQPFAPLEPKLEQACHGLAAFSMTVSR